MSFLQTIRQEFGAAGASDEPKASVHQLHNLDGATPYALSALNQECANVTTAPEGTRNHTLNRATFSLAQLVAGGELPETTVREQLTQAALACGLTHHEIEPTLNSGLRAGSDHPRATPPPTPTPDVTTITDTPKPEGLEERLDQKQDLTDEDRAYLLQLQRHQAVQQEVERERARREARQILDAEDNLKTFRVPPSRPTLTAELLIADPPLDYAVDQLLPMGGNVLLTAQFKTGKSTTINNLAKSFADQIDFLGKYTVHPDSGRTAIFNYEVDDRLYRKWLRELNINNTDNVSLLNLRGFRMPITVKYVEDWIVNWLGEHQITNWIVDPFARAFTGVSENDNTEVGRFLDTLDVIKNRAGVQNLILPTHTGREKAELGEERARGATRLDDWADVRWFLTKDDADIRYFRATGRDVDVEEQMLTYDEETRWQTIGGGDRAWEKRKRAAQVVVDHVDTNPGCSRSSIYGALRAAGYTGRESALQAHIDAAVYEHKVTQIEPEKNGDGYKYMPLGVTVLVPGA